MFGASFRPHTLTCVLALVLELELIPCELAISIIQDPPTSKINLRPIGHRGGLEREIRVTTMGALKINAITVIVARRPVCGLCVCYWVASVRRPQNISRERQHPFFAKKNFNSGCEKQTCFL